MSKETIADVKNKVSMREYKSLYDLINEYSELANTLELGELTPELEEQLIANQIDYENKILGMYYVIKMNDAKIEDFYKLEIEKFRGKIKSIENSNKWLKEKCLFAINTFGTDGKIKSDALNVTAVNLTVLNIDEEIMNQRFDLIRKYILGTDEDIVNVSSDENDYTKVNLTFKGLTIEQAREFMLDLDVKPEVEITYKGKEIVNELKRLREEDPSLFDKNQLELVGVSLGVTSYPKFT